jgi:hypothetical protein
VAIDHDGSEPSAPRRDGHHEEYHLGPVAPGLGRQIPSAICKIFGQVLMPGSGRRDFQVLDFGGRHRLFLPTNEARKSLQITDIKGKYLR